MGDAAPGHAGDKGGRGHPLSPPPHFPPVPPMQHPQPSTAGPRVPIQGLAPALVGFQVLGAHSCCAWLPGWPPCGHLTVLSASWSSSLVLSSPLKLFKSLIWLNLSNRFVLPCELMCLIPGRLTPDAQPAEPRAHAGPGTVTSHISLVILTLAAPQGVGSWANPLVAHVPALGDEWQRVAWAGWCPASSAQGRQEQPRQQDGLGMLRCWAASTWGTKPCRGVQASLMGPPA